MQDGGIKSSLDADPLVSDNGGRSEATAVFVSPVLANADGPPLIPGLQPMAAVRTPDSATSAVKTNRALFDALCNITRAGLMIMEKIVLVGRVVPPNHPNFRSDLFETIREAIDGIASDLGRPHTPYVWGSD